MLLDFSITAWDENNGSQLTSPDLFASDSLVGTDKITETPIYSRSGLKVSPAVNSRLMRARAILAGLDRPLWRKPRYFPSGIMQLIQSRPILIIWSPWSPIQPGEADTSPTWTVTDGSLDIESPQSPR